MCGICGKLNFDRARPVDAGLVRSMMNHIRHRGPDGAGQYVSGPIGLGHRRLSIIDLDTGEQPMSNEDGTLQLVFNGEIYNYQALRRELVQQGHRFKSASDTEVIVHLYEEMGDDCVDRLEGMFAFALWDARRQRLLLARDRVGIKPLYVADTGQSLVFGSELKSILVDPEVRRRVDAAAIDRFLTYYYLPGKGTLLEGITKLEPGHCLSVCDGKVTVRRYWDLRLGEQHPAPPFDAAVAQLQGLLGAAVRSHMIADVPVGVLLSGGVDSSGVLAHAAAQSERPLHTFTMGFEGQRFADERPYARLAAASCGSVHHETSLSAREFRDFLPHYVWHMEEPVCEPPAIALYHVARLARDTGVKVLLSGEGGDEAFGGYQDYRNLLMLERLKSGGDHFRRGLGAGLRALSQLGWQRASHYAALVDLDLADYYYSRSSTPTSPFNRMKDALCHGEFMRQVDRGGSDAPTRRLLAGTSQLPPLDRMLHVDIKTWLPDDLLVKADKMTMAASVELRVPLLDVHILDFAAALPARYRVEGLQLKRILKAALAPRLPARILARSKAGFPVPYAHWLRHELRDYVGDTLLASHARTRQYFSRDAVARLLASLHHGEPFAKEVFSLLVLELWHQQFLASPLRPPAWSGRVQLGTVAPASTGPVAAAPCHP